LNAQTWEYAERNFGEERDVKGMPEESAHLKATGSVSLAAIDVYDVASRCEAPKLTGGGN